MAATRQDGIIAGDSKAAADQVRILRDSALGDHTYRFGKGEPAVKVYVKHPRGLERSVEWMRSAFVKPTWTGSLDVAGDIAKLCQPERIAEATGTRCTRLAPHRSAYHRGEVRRTDRRSRLTTTSAASSISCSWTRPAATHTPCLHEMTSAGTLQRASWTLPSRLRLQPGDRVLDVGGGWGSFTNMPDGAGFRSPPHYFEQSERYVSELIRRLQLPCQVLNQISHYTASTPTMRSSSWVVMEHFRTIRPC